MFRSRLSKLIALTTVGVGVPTSIYYVQKIKHSQELEDQLEKHLNETQRQLALVDESSKELTSLQLKTQDLIKQLEQTSEELAYYRSMYGVDRFDGLPIVHGSPRPISPIHKQLIQYGLPSNSNLWFYDQFIVSNNIERRVPNWVIQRIEKGDHQFKPKTSDRKQSTFNNNTPHISVLNRADNRDYLGSGWSRGHMVPAGDMQMYNQLAMDQTFLLNSNIVPQDLQNNVNFWYRFEVFCKSNLAKQFDSVTVVSGPLYLPNLIEPIIEDVDSNNNGNGNGNRRFPRKKEKRFIKHEVIGENNVAVPTHLFKVILAEKKEEDKGGDSSSTDKRFVGAFVIPNEPISSSAKLQDYEVSLAQLERMSGLEFFNRLRNSSSHHQLDALCEEIDCSVMTEKQLEVWNIPRRIGWSKNRQELDKVMKEVDQKKIEIDDKIEKAYQDKLKELNQQQQQQQQQVIQNSNSTN